MRGASVLTMFTAVRGLVHTRRLNSPDFMRGMSTRMSASKGSVALTQLPSIDISESDMTVEKWVGDLLVIPLHSPAEMKEETSKNDDPGMTVSIPAALEALDETIFDGAISDLVSLNFKGNPGETACLRLGRRNSVRMIAIIGIGPEPKSDDSIDATKFGYSLATIAKTHKPASMGVVLPRTASVSKVVGGLLYELYMDIRYKTGMCPFSF